MDYKKQAEDFLKKTKTSFEVEFVRSGRHFEEDTRNRDIYLVTLTREGRKYSFEFGQSIARSGKYIIVYEADNYHRGELLHTKEELNRARQSFIGFGKFWEDNKEFSEPTPYDVLACLQKYDVGSFEDFCGEFGYNTDSRKSERIYKAVINEYNNLKMLYSDKELELMREIV